MPNLDPGLVAQLPAAYVTGMLFLLVIGGGAVGMAHLRARAHGSVEHATLATGFRLAGRVVVVFGVALFAASAIWLQPLGPWFHVIPGAIVIDGLLFLRTARRFSTSETR